MYFIYSKLKRKTGELSKKILFRDHEGQALAARFSDLRENCLLPYFPARVALHLLPPALPSIELPLTRPV
jgi:hypothetical protein